MKIVTLIQCRLSSSRLPGKAALDLHGTPLLAHVIERCRLLPNAPSVCVTTSEKEEDDIVVALAEDAGAMVYRGPLDDVRLRMLGAARSLAADAFIRVTADNVFVEPRYIDQLVALKRDRRTCPYAVHSFHQVVEGTAAEMVDVTALEDNLSLLPPAGREHVTTGLSLLDGAIELDPDSEIAEPNLSLTIDRLDQFVAVWRLMRRFGSGKGALREIVAAYRAEGPGEAYPVRSKTP